MSKRKQDAACSHEQLAGTPLVRFPNVNIDAWNKIFEISVTGNLRGVQTCAPLIRESGGGSIVNIGSVAGIAGNFSTALE